MAFNMLKETKEEKKKEDFDPLEKRHPKLQRASWD